MDKQWAPTLSEFIEDLQYNAWSNLGVQPPVPLSRDETKASLDIVDHFGLARERARKNGFPERKEAENAARRSFIEANPPASEFENPSAYLALLNTWYKLERLLPKLNKVHDFPRPIVATMPHGSLSASAHWYGAEKRRILFFDSGLIPFTSWVAYSYCRILKEVSLQDGSLSAYTYDEALLQRDPEKIFVDHPAIEVAGVLARLVNDGIISEGSPWGFTPPPERELIFDDCMSDALNFVVGHELGHLGFMHREIGSDPRVKISGKLQEWQEELACDAFGRLVAHTAYADLLQSAPDPNLYIGQTSRIDFFLWGFCAIEYLVSFARYGSAKRMATESHPSNTRRRIELNRYSMDLVRQKFFKSGLLSRGIGFWRRSEGEVELERLQSNLQLNLDANAVFWSIVIHACVPLLRKGHHSPLWNSLRSLKNASLACERPWQTEDAEWEPV